jgi:hypothetical protein
MSSVLSVMVASDRATMLVCVETGCVVQWTRRETRKKKERRLRNEPVEMKQRQAKNQAQKKDRPVNVHYVDLLARAI